MESLVSQLQNLALNTNYVREKDESYFTPNVNTHVNQFRVEQHQRAVLFAMNKYVYPDIVFEVLHNRRRTTTDLESILTDFFKGDKPQHKIVRDANYNLAVQYARLAFQPDQPVRPIHLLDIEHHYPIKWQTNAEPPFSTSPTFLNMLPPDTKPTTGNMKHIIFEFTRQWHHEIKDNTASFDDYLFFMLLHIKTTIVKSDEANKLRSIWGVPKPWIYAQIMFHWTLFACYRRNPQRYPLLWGYETFTGGWFRLNSELFCSFMQCSFIMIDWKSFDKDVPHEGIDDVSDNTESYIDFDHGYLPTVDYPDTASTWTPLKASRLRRLYKWTSYAYKNTPIVLPDGSKWRRQFATLPSGLYTTQYYDSHWNYIMIATILIAMGFDPRMCIIKVLGDDSIIRLYVLIPPNLHSDFLSRMQELATHYFGTTISINKSGISNRLNGCEVLSYTNSNGLPRRNEVDLLAKLYHTPARQPTPEKTMATAIGIAYANVGTHKSVHNVCHDLYKHYASQGYTPDSSGLKHALGDDPHSGIHLSLDKFPSFSDVKAQLLSLNYVNKATYNRFFPRTHFTSDY